jgi:5-methylcytosine-specific restriction protein A
MTNLPRACLGCGQLVRGASRCPTCAAVVEANRPHRPTRSGYTAAERKRRAAAVADWRDRFGDWCPGWADRPPHPVEPPNDLTADHLVPVAAGGHQSGALVVRCRVCNGAKGARA